MIKRLAVLAIILFQSVTIFAQGSDNPKKLTGIEKASRDFLMLQFTYENWSKPDSIKTTGFGRGFNAYICYDFPFNKKSNFSFAAGLGVGVSNIYFNNQVIVLTDTGSTAQARFIPENKDYKKYKLTTTYLEAPFEIRYFGNKDNRNKGFKAAIGLRVGALVGAHTKGSTTVGGTKIIDKENSKRYLEKWRYSATLRLGWGNFSLLGTYNLNGVFKSGSGPEVTPYSLGFVISGL